MKTHSLKASLTDIYKHLSGNPVMSLGWSAALCEKLDVFQDLVRETGIPIREGREVPGLDVAKLKSSILGLQDLLDKNDSTVDNDYKAVGALSDFSHYIAQLGVRGSQKNPALSL